MVEVVVCVVVVVLVDVEVSVVVVGSPGPPPHVLFSPLGKHPQHSVTFVKSAVRFSAAARALKIKPYGQANSSQEAQHLASAASPVRIAVRLSNSSGAVAVRSMCRQFI